MQDDRLAAQHITRRSGNEPFRSSQQDLPHRLLDFWQWSSSDLISNTMRGLVAEYLVALALGVADTTRIEWEPYDLQTVDGVKVEVKSSARFQTWEQTSPYPVTFDIGQKYGYDVAGKRESDKRRQADVYVFCVLDHAVDPLDPLNLDHWEFYVLPASTLNETMPTQSKVRLTVLLKLHPKKVGFEEIAHAIADLTNFDTGAH